MVDDRPARAMNTAVLRRWAPFGCAALAAVIIAAIAGAARPALFLPFFGGFPPVIAVALAAAAGAVALAVLASMMPEDRHPLRLEGRPLFIAAALALPFLIVAIGIDLTLRFPRDINVPLPWALAFYPTMAFFVECALHAAPFALVFWAGRKAFSDTRIAVVTAILLPCLIEPLLQAGYSSGAHAGLLPIAVAIHVFAISAAQLALFWRYGFWPMLIFRLSYYVLWHGLWGAMRLDVLF